MNSSACRQKAGRRHGLRSGTWTALLIPVLALMSMSSMTGCTARSGGVVIDPRLTAPLEVPEPEGRTCRDVIRLAIERRQVLQECSDRIDEIRGLTR